MLVSFTSLSSLLLLRGKKGQGMDVAVTLACCHKRVLWASRGLAGNSWGCTPEQQRRVAGFLRMRN